MAKLAGLAADWDTQLKKHTLAKEWRELFDWAWQLFCDALLPQNLSQLLTQVFAVNKLPANCEAVLAKVTSASQSQGY